MLRTIKSEFFLELKPSSFNLSHNIVALQAEKQNEMEEMLEKVVIESN